jgi:hypothetical protein
VETGGVDRHPVINIATKTTFEIRLGIQHPHRLF